MPKRLSFALLRKIPYGSSLLPGALLTRVIRHPRKARSFTLFAFLWYGLTDRETLGFLRWLQVNPLAKDVEFNGQMLQDAWVASQIGENGYFVDVGAAYPKKYSNTYSLQNDYGWHGLLIEANPNLAIGLQKRALSGDVKVLNVAVSQTEGTVELLNAGPMSSLTHTVFSDHLGERRMKVAGTNSRIQVESLTLTTLLKVNHAPKVIDYLSIDIEGADLEGLKTLDLNDYEVKLISIEHNMNAAMLEAFDEFLIPHGYQRVCGRWSSIDAWYVKCQS